MNEEKLKRMKYDCVERIYPRRENARTQMLIAKENRNKSDYYYNLGQRDAYDLALYIIDLIYSDLTEVEE